MWTIIVKFIQIRINVIYNVECILVKLNHIQMYVNTLKLYFVPACTLAFITIKYRSWYDVCMTFISITMPKYYLSASMFAHHICIAEILDIFIWYKTKNKQTYISHWLPNTLKQLCVFTGTFQSAGTIDKVGVVVSNNYNNRTSYHDQLVWL